MSLLEIAKKEAEMARQSKHEMAFLKIRDEVMEGLKRGYPIRALYRAACKMKQFSGSLTAFTGYVHKHCKEALKTPSSSPSS